MLIRREAPEDIPAIRAVTRAAFAKPDNPDPLEAPLVDELRSDEGWLPALSLVALGGDGEIIGHVLCTRGHVEGAPVVGLGPLSVLPAFQRRGVGLALVHTMLGAVDALGEPLVALLGNPAYYGRYGFRPSTDYDILPPEPEWGHYFQVRTLTAYTPEIKGTFRYPRPFDGL